MRSSTQTTLFYNWHWAHAPKLLSLAVKVAWQLRGSDVRQTWVQVLVLLLVCDLQQFNLNCGCYLYNVYGVVVGTK